MELYLLIVMPIFASLLLFLIPGRVTTWLCTGIYGAVLAVTLYLFWRVRFAGEIISTKSGGSFLGITLYCDRTAAVFLVLVAFIFLCVFVYTHSPGQTNKMFSFLMTVLEGLVMLIFLSRDLFNIYVAVEVATIVCAILIMYKKESRSIYDGLVYLLTSMTGMLFFLLGIGMIYRQFGVLDFDGVAAVLAGGASGSVELPYALIMTGVCLKCAIVPMHFWLPLAHGTPSALSGVSALLSGIYVKSGIYLFVRVQDLFSPVIRTEEFFFWLGVITSIAGIIMAVCQCDIKLILAYHTISQLGLIIAGLSTGSAAAQAGAMLHIINHAMFKSLLFLSAGLLIAAYGTRNVYKIRGVFRQMPAVGMAVAAGILGITGAPFFNGSISKYLLAQGGSLADYAFLVINFGTALSFVKFGRMLFGNGRPEHVADSAGAPDTRTADTSGSSASAASDAGAPAARVSAAVPAVGDAGAPAARVSAAVPFASDSGTPAAHASDTSAVSARATGVVLLLSLMCLLTGVFAAPMLQLIFEMDLEIGILGYLKKAVIWGVSIFAAYLVYTKIISRSARLKAGIDFSADFNQMILCTGASFAVLLVAAHIFTIA